MGPNKTPATKPEINLKTPKYILVGLIVLQVIAMAATIFFFKGRGGSGEGDGGSSSSSLLPIWLVVFIPLLVRRKRLSPQRKKLLLWVLVLLASLVLLAMILFALKIAT